MDDLRDTSRQLIPNLGEGFKQFMTSRVIRGIKIFLQSTWSYKNIQKRCFVSKFPEFLQNSPKIGLKFSWFWDKNAEVMAFFTIPYRSYTVWNMLDHAIWFKSLRSLRVVYNNRGQLKNTDISGALYLLKFSMGILKLIDNESLWRWRQRCQSSLIDPDYEIAMIPPIWTVISFLRAEKIDQVENKGYAKPSRS